MPKKVLIVDDEQNIRNLVRLTLSKEGFELHEAIDGLDAIAKVKDLRPDLVILDVMMPGKNGYQICEEIKANTATAHAYVIFLSARSSKATEQAMEQAGGDYCMTKPFEVKILRQVVREWAKNHDCTHL